MNNRRLQYIAVFLTSVLLMCLEFVEIRIMGFSHWFHLVYFSITMALLGFAVSGTVLSVNKRLQEIRWETLAALSLLGFGVSGFGAMIFGATVVGNTVQLLDGVRRGDLLPILRIYLPLMILLSVPFFFTSLLICRTLMDMREEANRAYAVNLIGTAAGAMAFLLLIEPLGAYGLMCLLIASAAALALAMRPSGRVKLALWIMLAVSLAGSIRPDIYFRPRVDASKSISPFYPGEVFETKWTPLWRVDFVHQSFGALITMDGDAHTWLYRIPPQLIQSPEPIVPHYEQASRHLVFHLTPEAHRQSALIIGAGGGMDVVAAYQAGFRHIDGVDLDRVRLDLLKGKYSNYIGDLYNNPRVSLHVVDGRNFVRNTKNKYDAIILYNVDTIAGMTTGSYNLAENYLYTYEAFQDFFDVLSENGSFQVTRMSWGDNEIYKLFNTGALMLLKNGLDPDKHMVMIQNGPRQYNILISKNVISNETLQAVAGFYKFYGDRDSVLEGEKRVASILYAGQYPREGQMPRLQELYALATAGRIQKAYDEEPLDIRPATDDRPFFFEHMRWDRIVKDLFHLRLVLPTAAYNNWSGLILSLLLAVSSIVVAALVAYSWWGIAKKPDAATTTATIGFFSFIGLGYMFVQMSLIQRLGLVLGHPIISMAVIIPTLLCAMGASGYFTSRPVFQRKGYFLGALAAPVVALVLFEAVFVRLLLGYTTEAPAVRMLATIAAIIPVGLALGLCFPLGLLSLQRHSASCTPIGWTANGGASVLGSILAMMVSLAFGFHAAMLLAIVCYAAAFTVMLARRPWQPPSV